MAPKDKTIPPLARFPEEWAEVAVRLGGRSFHGKSIFRWIHARGVTDAAAMTDLPAALRTRLVEEEGLGGVLDIVREARATDDTRKLLVALKDGANVETVLIPRVAGAGESSRRRSTRRTPMRPPRSRTRTSHRPRTPAPSP